MAVQKTATEQFDLKEHIAETAELVSWPLLNEEGVENRRLLLATSAAIILLCGHVFKIADKPEVDAQVIKVSLDIGQAPIYCLLFVVATYALASVLLSAMRSHATWKLRKSQTDNVGEERLFVLDFSISQSQRDANLADQRKVRQSERQVWRQTTIYEIGKDLENEIEANVNKAIESYNKSCRKSEIIPTEFTNYNNVNRSIYFTPLTTKILNSFRREIDSPFIDELRQEFEEIIRQLVSSTDNPSYTLTSKLQEKAREIFLKYREDSQPSAAKLEAEHKRHSIDQAKSHAEAEVIIRAKKSVRFWTLISTLSDVLFPIALYMWAVAMLFNDPIVQSYLPHW